MNKALKKTQQEFESSCVKTREYLAWHRLFKKEFTKFLTTAGAVAIEIGKSNHFDMSGFFTRKGQVWWFRIEDVRWSKDQMLIRTALNYKDYTGGINQYITLMNGDVNFMLQFEEIMQGNAYRNLAYMS